MKRVTGIILAVLFASLTVVADKAGPQAHKHAVPCCNCACKMDKVSCHKMCVLPDGGRKRGFTDTENQLCTELCAMKRDGCGHVNR